MRTSQYVARVIAFIDESSSIYGASGRTNDTTLRCEDNNGMVATTMEICLMIKLIEMYVIDRHKSIMLFRMSSEGKILDTLCRKILA